MASCFATAATATSKCFSIFNKWHVHFHLIKFIWLINVNLFYRHELSRERENLAVSPLFTQKHKKKLMLRVVERKVRTHNRRHWKLKVRIRHKRRIRRKIHTKRKHRSVLCFFFLIKSNIHKLKKILKEKYSMNQALNRMFV